MKIISNNIFWKEIDFMKFFSMKKSIGNNGLKFFGWPDEIQTRNSSTHTPQLGIKLILFHISRTNDGEIVSYKEGMNQIVYEYF